MSKQLQVRETSSAPVKTAPGKYRIKIIDEGQGSTGYYPREVLERDGAKAFPAGTHSYFNHPSMSEEMDRPERDVRDIMGVLESDAEYEDGALYGNLVPLPQHINLVEALRQHVGMSISAAATFEENEDPGSDGSTPTVKELIASPFNSVDMVTRAGRGGAILALLESAGFRTSPVTDRKGSNMAQEQNGDLNKVTEAVAGLTTEVGKLVERAAAEDKATKEAEEAKTKINPVTLAVELATKLSESGLAPVQYAKVAEAAAKGTKIEDAIAAEKSYAEAIIAAAGGTKSEPVTGKIVEGGAFEFDDAEDLDKLVESLHGDDNLPSWMKVNG